MNVINDTNIAYKIRGREMYHTYGQCKHLKKAIEPVEETTIEEAKEDDLVYCSECERLDGTGMSRWEYSEICLLTEPTYRNTSE